MDFWVCVLVISRFLQHLPQKERSCMAVGVFTVDPEFSKSIQCEDKGSALLMHRCTYTDIGLHINGVDCMGIKGARGHPSRNEVTNEVTIVGSGPLSPSLFSVIFRPIHGHRPNGQFAPAYKQLLIWICKGFSNVLLSYASWVKVGICCPDRRIISICNRVNGCALPLSEYALQQLA